MKPKLRIPSSFKCLRLEFTPLEFETKKFNKKCYNHEELEFTPLEFETYIVDGKTVFKTPVPNGASKGQFPYVCNVADKGRELNNNNTKR